MKVCRQWEEKKSPKTLIMIFPDYLDAVDRARILSRERSVLPLESPKEQAYAYDIIY